MGQIGMTFIEMFINIIPCGDKFLHFVVGNFIFYCAYIFNLSKIKSWLIVLCFGIGKEIFDIFKSGEIQLENLLDLTATIIII